jgi:hypothetical protein
MALHMAASPVRCLAVVHVAASTQNALTVGSDHRGGRPLVSRSVVELVLSESGAT